MNNLAGETSTRLVSFVERIERINEELKALNADKTEIFAEAKGDGYDTKALKRVVIQRTKEPAIRDEEDQMFDAYWLAVEKLGT